MLIRAADAVVHETPNAVMTTSAAPSLGSRELATWRVEMAPGSTGPAHTADREQVWLITAGRADVIVDDQGLVAHAGDTVILPAAATRRIAAPDGLTAIVASTAGAHVTTEAQGTRPLPWAA